jgi:hypothetical protein
MKPITLHIYRDAEGITAVHDGGGIIVTREFIQTLVKDITKFYQSMGDAEIERYITWTKEAGRGKNQRSNKGYVYLIKSYDDFYKIGQSTLKSASDACSSHTSPKLSIQSTYRI